MKEIIMSIDTCHDIYRVSLLSVGSKFGPGIQIGRLGMTYLYCGVVRVVSWEAVLNAMDMITL